MARPKKPKAAPKPKKAKVDKLPEQVRLAIEAKQSQNEGKRSSKGAAVRNTGYGGGTPKRTGGRDR